MAKGIRATGFLTYKTVWKAILGIDDKSVRDLASLGDGVTADASGNVFAGEIGPVWLRGITKFTPRLTRIDPEAE